MTAFATPTRYFASTCSHADSGVLLGEDDTLHGLVEQLLVQPDFGVDDYTIAAVLDGVPVPVEVPCQAYAYQSGERWGLFRLEDVPEHFEIPLPEFYLAVEFAQGFRFESPTLSGVIQQLHRAGHTLVSMNDLKLCACFARAQGGGHDLEEVPLDLLCHDEEYFFESPEEPSPLKLGQPRLVCKRKLRDDQGVQAHYLYGAYRRYYRRLQGLPARKETKRLVPVAF